MSFFKIYCVYLLLLFSEMENKNNQKQNSDTFLKPYLEKYSLQEYVFCMIIYGLRAVWSSSTFLSQLDQEMVMQQ